MGEKRGKEAGPASSWLHSGAQHQVMFSHPLHVTFLTHTHTHTHTVFTVKRCTQTYPDNSLKEKHRDAEGTSKSYKGDSNFDLLSWCVNSFLGGETK